METTSVFVPIVKAEKQADGTLLVSGPVSSGALDRDKQICDPAWLDAAVPKWFGESGNIREMHQPIAAGTAVDYWKAEGEQHWIRAKVVDSNSVAKVDNQVLKGFSIGIKGPRVIRDTTAPAGRIVDGTIFEVSLVDRPANPECILTVAKSDEEGKILPIQEQVLEERTPEAWAARVAAVEPEPIEVVLDSTPAEPVEAAPIEASPVAEAAQKVRDTARDVLASLATLGLPVGKADESADIAGANDAIACIAKLIQSEAQGLVDGEIGEAYDISILLDAISSLRYFIARESEESSQDVMLSDTAPSSTDDAQAVDNQQTDAIMKADTEPDLIAKVEARWTEALTKVEESHKAELAALRDELAKVMAQPVPGGPVRIRTKSDQAVANNRDTEALQAKAAWFETQADATTDRMLAEGYRELARKTLESAR